MYFEAAPRRDSQKDGVCSTTEYTTSAQKGNFPGFLMSEASKSTLKPTVMLLSNTVFTAGGDLARGGNGWLGDLHGEVARFCMRNDTSREAISRLGKPAFCPRRSPEA